MVDAVSSIPGSFHKPPSRTSLVGSSSKTFTDNRLLLSLFFVVFSRCKVKEPLVRARFNRDGLFGGLGFSFLPSPVLPSFSVLLLLTSSSGLVFILISCEEWESFSFEPLWLVSTLSVLLAFELFPLSLMGAFSIDAVSISSVSGSGGGGGGSCFVSLGGVFEAPLALEGVALLLGNIGGRGGGGGGVNFFFSRGIPVLLCVHGIIDDIIIIPL